MNELQNDVLEKESLLNLSERNQGENEKIIGTHKASPERKMPVKWDGDKKFSKALEAMGEKNRLCIQVILTSHLFLFTPLYHGSLQQIYSSLT